MVEVLNNIPSASFIINTAAAPPVCATTALAEKSQVPRTQRAADPDNCKMENAEAHY